MNDKLYHFYNRVRLKLIKESGILSHSRYKKVEEKRGVDADYVTHVTYYQRGGNSGDTTLSNCVRRIWEQQLGIQSWRLFSVDEKVTEEMIQVINSGKALVIGGGGLFLPDTNANTISGWQWAISKEDLDKIRVPVIVYAVGWNYFKGQDASDFFIDNLRFLIDRACFVGIRNMGSILAIEREIGPSKLCYQPCITTLIREVYKDLPPKKETGRIAFNMAFDREKLRYGEEREIILSQVAQAARTIAEKGYEIVYVMHCPNDIKFIPYMKRAGIKFKVMDTTMWIPDKLIRFYNEVDCVIGMRGHAQMIPFGVNCEIISLGSHEKMKWFLMDIDSENWYIDLTVDTGNIANRIVDLFTEIHENDREHTKKRLAEEQSKLWNITQKNIEQIRRKLLCTENPL